MLGEGGHHFFLFLYIEQDPFAVACVITESQTGLVWEGPSSSSSSSPHVMGTFSVPFPCCETLLPPSHGKAVDFDAVLPRPQRCWR